MAIPHIPRPSPAGRGPWCRAGRPHGLACLATLVLGLILAPPTPAPAQQGQTPAPPPTATAAPTAAPTARGLLVPQRKTVLAAEIEGKIIDLPVRDGETVARGALLVALDCRIRELRRDRDAAEVRSARKALSVQRQLAGLRSGSALDAALAEADLGKAEADLAIAETMVEMCRITAPYAGRVVQVLVNAHQHVNAGQAMVEMLDHTALEVEVIVPSRWLNWLRTGTRFTFFVEETGGRHDGVIQRLGARIDPASQSLKVVGRLETTETGAQSTTGASPGALLPGMSGRVVFRP